MSVVQLVLSTNTPKYRWKFVYWPIFKRSNIGRKYRWTNISVSVQFIFWILW